MADSSRGSSRDIITIAVGLVVGFLLIAALYVAICGRGFSDALGTVEPVALVVLIGTVLLRCCGARRR